MELIVEAGFFFKLKDQIAANAEKRKEEKKKSDENKLVDEMVDILVAKGYKTNKEQNLIDQYIRADKKGINKTRNTFFVALNEKPYKDEKEKYLMALGQLIAAGADIINIRRIPKRNDKAETLVAISYALSKGAKIDDIIDMNKKQIIEYLSTQNVQSSVDWGVAQSKNIIELANKAFTNKWSLAFAPYVEEKIYSPAELGELLLFSQLGPNNSQLKSAVSMAYVSGGYDAIRDARTFIFRGSNVLNFSNINDVISTTPQKYMKEKGYESEEDKQKKEKKQTQAAQAETQAEVDAIEDEVQDDVADGTAG